MTLRVVQRLTWQQREDGLAAVQTELARERANALGRVGEALEREIARMLALAVTLEAAAGEARTAGLRAYRKAREAAMQLQWDLVVQREALGLHDTTVVDRQFPIPPPIPR
jgi:hypothetical protein